MAEAIKFAEEIKQRSPDAIANTKLLFNKTWFSTIRQALNWETKLQKRLIGRYNQRAAISQGTAKKDKAKPFKQRA
jgi:enoyl-CoA hydratase/carnithine racemase